MQDSTDTSGMTFDEIAAKYGEEAAIQVGIAADPDTWELTEEDFAQMRPASEVEKELGQLSRKEEAPKMTTNEWKNRLYFGDNLDILRDTKYIPDGSVDLIYLDPPFKSNADYNVLFTESSGQQSAAQVTAFEDTWHWIHKDNESENALWEVVNDAPFKLSKLLESMYAFVGGSDMLAYLTMMAPRLVELHRVLKETGSIYLHCDPTASHYLKLLMDSVFGSRNFRNEIIWHYRKWPTGKFSFQRNHDIILFYSKSQDRSRVFNQLYMERAASTLKRFGTAKIVSGHDENGQRVPSQVESQDSVGVRQDDVWEIGRVPPIKQLFPTQKPDALLERIIKASSNEGDVVLDPFCGCGTAIITAERLNRRWLGIDITHLAVTLIRHRLHDTFKDDLKPNEVLGQPQDVASAQALAIDSENSGRYQFEWWALGLVDARPAQDRKKGADSGIDGYINFFDDNSRKAKRVVVQVKSGQVTRNQIATLNSDRQREKAEIGLFITLQPPTRPMEAEAASAGLYTPEHFPDSHYPRIQILTIEELLSSTRQAEYPRLAPGATFRRAARRRRSAGNQSKLV